MTATQTAGRAIGGILPPIPTPFRDGRIDAHSLAALLEYLGDCVDGVLLGGSVGEVPSLTLHERTLLIKEMAAYRASGKRVAVSIADNSIENTRILAEAAGEIGAELVVVACPSYFENSHGMLEQYFAAVATFAPADMCLYDNPVATHTLLSVTAIAELANEIPRLVAVKVTDTALGKVRALRAKTELAIFSGEDAVLMHQLADGVDGAMVALPLIFPEETAELVRLAQAGRHEACHEVFRAMAPFVQVALGAYDYPAVIKTVLHHYGVIASDEVRLPLTALATGRRRQALSYAQVLDSARRVPDVV